MSLPVREFRNAILGVQAAGELRCTWLHEIIHHLLQFIGDANALITGKGVMDTAGIPWEPPMLLTIAVAARLLAISPRQMHDLTKEGQFTPIRLGRSVRFSKLAIESWIQSHLATPTT